MKAAIYIRVSTEEQKLKGYSLPDQIDTCSKKALELGATDIEIFPEEGESGAFIDRPELDRLFAAVKSGDIQLVIALDPDRLARDLGTQLFIADEIEKNAKLDFVTYSRGNPSSPEDTMFFQMKGAVSQYERSKILQRTASGRKRKALMGKIVNPGGWSGHTGAYGYKYINENNDPRFEIIEAEADIVRYIYNLAYEDELPVPRIVERLNREKIPAPKGGRWHPSPVKRLLTNEVYAGVFHNFRYKGIMTAKRTPSGRRQHLIRERPKEEHILAEVTAIIDREIWDAVQIKYNTLPRTFLKHEAILGSRIRCSKCGNMYSPQITDKHVYYRCRGRRNCNMPMLQVKKTDDKVWHEIVRMLSNPELIKEYIGNPNITAIADAERDIQKIRTKINSAIKLKDEMFNLRLEGLLSAEELKKRLTQTTVKIQALSTELSTMQEHLENQKKPFDFNADEFCKYFATRIEQATYQEKVEVVRDLDLRLVLHPDKVLEINWPFTTTVLRLEPKWFDHLGYSMTPEMKAALDKAAATSSLSEYIREAIINTPLDADYKRASKANRVYSTVCLTEDTFNRVKQLQGTYHESALRIIEWAIYRQLKQDNYL